MINWLLGRLVALVLVDPRKGEIFTACFSTAVVAILILYAGGPVSIFGMLARMVAPLPLLPYIFGVLATVQWLAVFSYDPRLRQIVAFIDLSFWAFAFMSIMRPGSIGIPHVVSLVLAISALFTIVQVRLMGKCRARSYY